jgi:hypothetical protein
LPTRTLLVARRTAGAIAARLQLGDGCSVDETGGMPVAVAAAILIARRIEFGGRDGTVE